MLCPCQCIMSRVHGVHLSYYLGRLEKTMLLRYLLHKVLLLLVINKCLVGRYFETICISCFSSNFYPPILASISGSCLWQLLLWCLPNGDFSMSLISSTFLIGVLLEGRVGPLPCIYLVIHLVIFMTIDSWIFIYFIRYMIYNKCMDICNIINSVDGYSILWVIVIIQYHGCFVVQIAPLLTPGSPFRLAPVPVWQGLIFFWALPYFLAPQDTAPWCYIYIFLPQCGNRSLLWDTLAPLLENRV